MSSIYSLFLNNLNAYNSQNNDDMALKRELIDFILGTKPPKYIKEVALVTGNFSLPKFTSRKSYAHLRAQALILNKDRTKILVLNKNKYHAANMLPGFHVNPSISQVDITKFLMQKIRIRIKDSKIKNADSKNKEVQYCKGVKLLSKSIFAINKDINWHHWHYNVTFLVEFNEGDEYYGYNQGNDFVNGFKNSVWKSPEEIIGLDPIMDRLIEKLQDNNVLNKELTKAAV